MTLVVAAAAAAAAVSKLVPTEDEDVAGALVAMDAVLLKPRLWSAATAWRRLR
jgi:hypothetical protein